MNTELNTPGKRKGGSGEITLCRFDESYLPAFVALNREWIEKHFQVECMDLAQLENPKSLILEPGGEIFFALLGGEAVGTCAMVPHGEKSFELAKMAVSPAARGRGIGDLLMSAAIDWAREKGADSITILSNTVLAPAISLYRKHGFVTVHLGDHPDYARCNIEMKRSLR